MTSRVGNNDGPFEDDIEPSDYLLVEGLFAVHKETRHEVGRSVRSLEVNCRKNNF